MQEKRNGNIIKLVLAIIVLGLILMFLFKGETDKDEDGVVKATKNYTLGKYEDLVYKNADVIRNDLDEYTNERLHLIAKRAGYEDIEKYSKDVRNFKTANKLKKHMISERALSAEMMDIWEKVPFKIKKLPKGELKKQTGIVEKDLKRYAERLSEEEGRKVSVSEVEEMLGTSIESEGKIKCREIMMAEAIADVEGIKVTKEDKSLYEQFFYDIYLTDKEEFKKSIGNYLDEEDSFKDSVLIWKVQKTLVEKGRKGNSFFEEEDENKKLESIVIKGFERENNVIDDMIYSLRGDYSLDAFSADDKSGEIVMVLKAGKNYGVKKINTFRKRILAGEEMIDEKAEAEMNDMIIANDDLENAELIMNSDSVRKGIKNIEKELSKEFGKAVKLEVRLVDSDNWLVAGFTEKKAF